MQPVKESNSGNPDRMQIIKTEHQKCKSTTRIYDVIWSSDRKKDVKGKLPAAGNTVDIKTQLVL